MLQPIQDVSMLFLATASINNAIEYYQLFKEIQKKKQKENPDYVPLNIACVFSPPHN
jgi:type I restriction enzyme R subunit